LLRAQQRLFTLDDLSDSDVEPIAVEFSNQTFLSDFLRLWAAKLMKSARHATQTLATPTMSEKLSD
jgi:hypothetical protein